MTEQTRRASRHMASPLAEATEDPENYSTLGVMRSAAGFYIGTFYTDPETGIQQPGSRDSVEYYETFDEAFEALEKGTFAQREHP